MAVYCFQCNKCFSSQSTLNRHLKTVHETNEIRAISYGFDVHNSKCFECSLSFKQINDLRNHLESVHKFQNEIEEITFDDFEAFENWLSLVSTEQNVQYVRVRAKKNKSSKDTSIFYYNCSRALIAGAKRTSKIINRKRVKKSQGCSKLEYLCTSQIKVVITNKQVKITYYKSHYKHNNEIQHLRINKKERSDIANKLICGVSVNKILDQNRDNFEVGSEIKRMHILTKKDVNNIKTSFGIVSDEGKRNISDAISIELFVEEQRTNENNCVLYYKSQGEKDSLLKSEDFCLILMNKSQIYMLKKFGENIIAIDSTHGLNKYDFELTTLMIIDEFGEGFPTATMFSNRKDTFIYEVFFSKVKDALGSVILTKTFMSDITNVFINAWNVVMQEPEKQLYCAWHVDKAWQINLKKIRDLEKRKWVYKTVKYLQNYENEDFVQILQNAINTFLEDEDTFEWGNYFQTYYGTNYKLWAACYRKGCGINTNMHLESMHRIIKYCYLEGKNVARLDKGLHAVLKFVRDKVVERIMKNTKGKNNCHIRDIHTRHRSAVTQIQSVEIIEENIKFHVKSLKTSKYYEVTNLSRNVCCPLQCQYCDICVHSFSCTCPDFYLKNTICKHIHAVVFKNQGQRSVENEVKPKDNNEYEFATHVETLNKNNTEKKQFDLIGDINFKLNEIRQKVETVERNENILNECNEYLKKASLILNVGPKIDATKLPIKKRSSPANKLIKKQSFFSTKRTIKKRASFIKKPSEEETKCLSNMLLNGPFISTDPNQDHSYY